MKEFSTWLNKGKSYECRFSGSNYVDQIMNVLCAWGISVQNSSKSICFFFFFFQLVIARLAIFIVMLVIRPIIQGQKWGEGAGINVG